MHLRTLLTLLLVLVFVRSADSFTGVVRRRSARFGLGSWIALRSRSSPEEGRSEVDDDFVEVNGLSLGEELERASLMYSFDAAAEADRLRLTWAIRDAVAECEVDGMYGNPVRDSSACGVACEECGGHGELQCRYCRGTGFFTIGDELIGSGNDCPVCKASGFEVCRPCQGTGAVAKWQKLRQVKK